MNSLPNGDTIVKLLNNNLPYRPFSTSDLLRGVYHHSQEDALKDSYIQLNAVNTLSVLSIDVDRALGYVGDYNLPQPNIVCYNPKNGHAHLLYVLDTPVQFNPTSSTKAKRFAFLVQTALTWAWKGDWDYIHLLQKNPFSPSWTVLWNRLQPWTLEELSDWFTEKDIKKAEKKRQSEKVRTISTAEGRNCTLFDTLRHWAYKAVKTFVDDGEWMARVLNKAMEINRQFPVPLGTREVMATAKSVAVWTAEHMTGDSKKTMAWNQIATQKSAQVRQAKKERNIVRAHQLYIEGVTTQADVAKIMGVSLRSVKAYLKESPKH